MYLMVAVPEVPTVLQEVLRPRDQAVLLLLPAVQVQVHPVAAVAMRL
jgi:hypothetical protein